MSDSGIVKCGDTHHACDCIIQKMVWLEQRIAELEAENTSFRKANAKWGNNYLEVQQQLTEARRLLQEWKEQASRWSFLLNDTNAFLAPEQRALAIRQAFQEMDKQYNWTDSSPWEFINIQLSYHIREATATLEQENAALKEEIQRLCQEHEPYYDILSDETEARACPALAIEKLLDLYHTADSDEYKRMAKEKAADARRWQIIKDMCVVPFAHGGWYFDSQILNGDTLEAAVDRLGELEKEPPA